MKITIIGAGNVAWHLAQALQKAGHTIVQVYSRTLSHAEDLASKVNAIPVSEFSAVHADTDMLIFSVKDDALPACIDALAGHDLFAVHTSGTVPLRLLSTHFSRSGVLYPLQTFSKNRTLDFRQVPLFIESAGAGTGEQLSDVAHTISDKVAEADSEKRKWIHLSAVFASNFSNYLYTVAADLLKEQQLPFEVLLPLIRETAQKLSTLSPEEAQTGPAIRGDQRTIDAHLQLLQGHEQWKTIYELFSRQIAAYRET